MGRCIALQILVALEENAEAKELRGPNSKITDFASPSSVVDSEDCSSDNPSFSKVSRKSHSRREVATSSSVDSGAMLKQTSVRMEVILGVMPANERRSVREGRREWGVGVVR